MNFWKMNDKLNELEARVQKLEGEDSNLTLKTSWEDYDDPNERGVQYRRIGNRVEFTGTYPPRSLNIISSTLEHYGSYNSAEVIGWETKTVVAEDCVLYHETVAGKIEHGVKKIDTHNFVLNEHRHVNVTAVSSGVYKGTFKIFMNKGDELDIDLNDYFKEFYIEKVE